MDVKTLVLGIDGMDPKIVSKLIEEGRMPNFEKLYFNELKPTLTPQSPVSWASIATGCNPGKTNIFDFIRRNPDNYLPILSLAKSKSTLAGTNYESFVKGKPFWDYLSEENIPVSVIRWPLTFPAGKIKGNMLSGLGVPDIRGFLSGYTYYTQTNEVKGDDKTILVHLKDNVIESEINGPRKRTSAGIVEVSVPFSISLSDDFSYANFSCQDNSFKIYENSWTPWIELSFKVGFAKKANAIARAYVLSLNPFRMYLSDVQIDPNNPLWDISYPKDFSKKLVDQVGLFNTLGIAEDTAALEDDVLSNDVFVNQVSMIEDERTKIFWTEFENWRSEGGVFAFVFDESDRLQHMFYNKNNSLIEDYYVQKDKLLGDIMSKIDSNDKLIVISDHGITNFTRSVELNAWLKKEGYLVLKNNKNLPLFKDVDWSKTKAYSVGFSGIYINLKGREGSGIVDASAKQDLVNEIISKLDALIDSNGDQVVHKAYSSEDVYSGDYLSESPDIIIGFNPNYRSGWESPIGGTPEVVISDNSRKWKADHIVDPIFVNGVLFTNFKVGNVTSNMDFAPTILKIYNISIPDFIDGRSLI